MPHDRMAAEDRGGVYTRVDKVRLGSCSLPMDPLEEPAQFCRLQIDAGVKTAQDVNPKKLTRAGLNNCSIGSWPVSGYHRRSDEECYSIALGRGGKLKGEKRSHQRPCQRMSEVSVLLQSTRKRPNKINRLLLGLCI